MLLLLFLACGPGKTTASSSWPADNAPATDDEDDGGAAADDSGEAGLDDPLSGTPPVVISTVPVAGETEVDPALDQITVTFSREMSQDRYSWVNDPSMGEFPDAPGDPGWTDARSTTLDVLLEPDTTYAVWLNHGEEYLGFASVEDVPLVPYLLVFHTATEAR